MPRTSTTLALAFLAVLIAPLAASAEQISPAPASTEDAAYANARAGLQRAAALRQNAKLQEAVEQYKTAAGLFREFTEKFPNSPNAYEARFLRAESLFHSSQFAAAAAEYEKLRDTTAGTKFFTDSAEGAVRAWEAEIAEQVRTGRLAPLKTLSANDRKDGEKITPRPIDDLRAKFVTAAEEFVNRLPEDEKTPKLAYQIALLHYQHENFDEARKRFEQIVDTWPKEVVAKDSAKLMGESYVAVKDWENAAKWVERLAPDAVLSCQSICGYNLADALFRRAQSHERRFEFGKAVDEYLELVEKYPGPKHRIAAQWNAANVLERIQNYPRAAEEYLRFDQLFPEHEKAPDAVWRAIEV